MRKKTGRCKNCGEKIGNYPSIHVPGIGKFCDSGRIDCYTLWLKKDLEIGTQSADALPKKPTKQEAITMI